MTRYLPVFVAMLAVACGQDYAIQGQPVDVNPGDVMDCGFTPISGTKLSRYDCNPVFSGTGEAWGEAFSSVGFRTQTVLGHPFYQIWYSAAPDGSNGGEYGLGYAVSANGTDWVTNPNNPVIAADGGWDATNMDAVVVVWDDTRDEYVLAYQGYNLDKGSWGLGMYTSADGVAWAPFNDGQPVLDFTKPIQGVTYCWPLGLTHDSTVGYLGFIGGQPSNKNVCQIYQFTAPNLDSGFVPGSEPVLRAGPEKYDASGMASATIAEYNGTYYAFYVGFEDWIQHPSQGYQSADKLTLSLATSTDGVTWTKDANNPLPVNLTQPGEISDVASQVVGSRVYLWVTDYYEALGTNAVGYYYFEPDIDPHP